MSDTPKESPAAVAEAFYSAFVRRDVDTLERLYAEDVHFRDAIFSYHDRRGVMNMWRKLLRSGRAGFAYEVLGVEGDVARVRWTADYELVRGRPIHNVIIASLKVVDGRIHEHVDDFDLARWARQAFPLGPLVSIPGVQGVLRRLIRARI